MAIPCMQKSIYWTYLFRITEVIEYCESTKKLSLDWAQSYGRANGRQQISTFMSKNSFPERVKGSEHSQIKNQFFFVGILNSVRLLAAVAKCKISCLAYC